VTALAIPSMSLQVDVFEEVNDHETTGQNKLSYIRYYNSLSVASTLASELGSNWRSNYDRFLQFISSTLITAERPDGQELNFYNNGGGWICDSDVDYTLTPSGTTWTLTDHNDTTEVYDGTFGLLQSIMLRNGYTQTMTYNPYNQLTNVTDSYSPTRIHIFQWHSLHCYDPGWPGPDVWIQQRLLHQ
jgi:uncharacterized protein RhaS with RHS repeats